MRLLLQRALFVDGTRYRVSSNGTDVPDTAEIPKGAKIWDGKQFVDVPEEQSARDALIKKSSKAVAKEEDEYEEPARVHYDPRYKSPDSPEPITGRPAGLDTIEGGIPSQNGQGKAEKEEGPLPPPMKDAKTSSTKK